MKSHNIVLDGLSNEQLDELLADILRIRYKTTADREKAIHAIQSFANNLERSAELRREYAAREANTKQLAERKGYNLTQDPQTFGYKLISSATGKVAFGDRPDVYPADIDDVEEWLSGNGSLSGRPTHSASRH
jgi:hypothetical protein